MGKLYPFKQMVQSFALMQHQYKVHVFRNAFADYLHCSWFNPLYSVQVLGLSFLVRCPAVSTTTKCRCHPSEYRVHDSHANQRLLQLNALTTVVKPIDDASDRSENSRQRFYRL